MSFSPSVEEKSLLFVNLDLNSFVGQLLVDTFKNHDHFVESHKVQNYIFFYIGLIFENDCG